MKVYYTDKGKYNIKNINSTDINLITQGLMHLEKLYKELADFDSSSENFKSIYKRDLEKINRIKADLNDVEI